MALVFVAMGVVLSLFAAAAAVWVAETGGRVPTL